MVPMDEGRLLELRKWSETLFKRPYNDRPVVVAQRWAGEQIQSVERLDTQEVTMQMNDVFNVFDLTHEATALDLSQTFAQLVVAQPDESGLEAVLDAVEAEFVTQNSDLVKFALSAFITNHPVGRNLYIPPVVEQSPEVFIPSH